MSILFQPSTSSTSKQDVGTVAYHSQRFKSRKRRYSAFMKECGAVVLAIVYLRQFLFGTQITVLTVVEGIYHTRIGENIYS